MAGKGVPTPQSKKSTMTIGVKINAIVQNSSCSTVKTKQSNKRESSGSNIKEIIFPKSTYHGPPTAYHSHQGQLPDPTVSFRSPSASSVPTEYYSTQGRPPDRSRNQ
eukprot:7292817-Ditylum_brightwellii.AAC.1